MIDLVPIRKFLSSKDLSTEEIDLKISNLNKKIEQLSAQNKFADDEYINATQDLASVRELKEKSSSLNNLIKKNEDAQELLSDPDYADLANSEIEETEKEIEELIKKLKELTTTPLRNDDKKAIFEIRPGVGGVEASLFAEDLYRMYTRYCNEQEFNIELMSLEYDQEGGIKQVIFLVNSPQSFKNFRFESGVHRVQRVPTTESAGRIHTSTASVVVLPKIEQKDVKIGAEDLRIDVFRAGGPGGQSVNTTDSAVRITHLPTGITVSCQNGKSQHKNKDMAMSILISKLNEIEEEKKSKEEKDMRNASILGGDRSAKIRTYNFQQSRITDHRINKSWFNLEGALNGEIADIVSEVSTTLREQINQK